MIRSAREMFWNQSFWGDCVARTAAACSVVILYFLPRAPAILLAPMYQSLARSRMPGCCSSNLFASQTRLSRTCSMNRRATCSSVIPSTSLLANILKLRTTSMFFLNIAASARMLSSEAEISCWLELIGAVFRMACPWDTRLLPCGLKSFWSLAPGEAWRSGTTEVNTSLSNPYLAASNGCWRGRSAAPLISRLRRSTSASPRSRTTFMDPPISQDPVMLELVL